MAMTEQRLIQVVSAAVDAMRGSLATELRQFAEQAVESHRRRMWVRSEWCCKDMAKFAAEVWAAPNPPVRDESTFGGVTLNLRGRTVNYCPFCGVLVGPSTK